MRTKVEFSYNKGKDSWNIHRIATQHNRWHNSSKRLPKEVIDICKDKSFVKSKPKIEKYFLKIQDIKKINIYLEAVEKSWRLIEKEYFKRLEKVTGKPLNIKTIGAHPTIGPSCPYNPDEYWFMINYFSSIPQALATCGHEIMHLHFHKYYWKQVEKQIGYEKTSDLKEALTVLLNLEFQNLWFVPDRGYAPHQELRQFIKEQWKKKKDFDLLLTKCIKYINKNEAKANQSQKKKT